MKILLVDDHELVRDTICAYLEKGSDLEVMVAGDFSSAAERITHDGPFDLVLLDYLMPGMNGLEGLAKAKALNGGKPVAIISGTAARNVAEQALAAGAAGFLPKTISARSLVHAVRFMIAGEQYAPIQFMTAPQAGNTHPLMAKLTRRELEVLHGLVAGRANKEIGRDLDLQEVTIKLHVKTLCRKLSARNRTHAAMIAKAAGL